jgi:hypothetical protein
MQLYTFRICLTPACADLNAVAAPRGRNLQIGIVIFKFKRIFYRYMAKALTIFFALSISVLSIACGSTTTANTSTHNGNVITNANAAELPPGMSTSPVPPSANTTPGIPAANAVTNVPPGATPTPGINPKNAVRTMKPGEKIPGIPDAATMKKQMSQPVDPSKLPPDMRNTMKSMNSNSAPPAMTKKPQ